MATTEQIEKIRAALRELNEAMNASKADENAGTEETAVKPLAATAEQTDAVEPSGNAATARDYLGNAGLAELASLIRAALKLKEDAFTPGYGLALEDGTLKVTLDTSLFVIVKELPTEPDVEDEDKLHLVPMGETEEGNEYAEYLWVDGKWELMGTLHTKVSLDDYYTKSETDAKLDLYLPLTGGTVTGTLSVDGDLKARLRRHDDAPNVVLSDNDWTLYQTPVEKFAETLKAHEPEVLTAVVAFPTIPDCGTDYPTSHDVSVWDVIARTDEMTSLSLKCADGRFALKSFGVVAVGEIPDYYIQCVEENTTGQDIHTTLTFTVGYSDGSESTVNMLAVQSAAASSGGSSGTSGHTGACDGVYVAYVDYDGVKRICAVSDWSDSLGAAQGVMVGDGTHEFLLAPTEYDGTMTFGLYGTLIGGVITTTTTANARLDFNGRLDTRALMAGGIDDTMAAGWCGAYAYGAVEAGGWWLPSCGELYLAYQHYSDIADALSAIGGTAVNSTYYWSSTQYSSSTAWSVGIDNGTSSYITRHSSSRVRAVAAFDYEL